ncbi:MAG: competence protein ComK [Acholeplasmatales bacterium]|nr:competence protein ComK [Acholeplasmatales bacterium]
MIYYIKHHPYGTEVIENNNKSTIIHKKSTLGYVKYLCCKKLIDFEGYIKQVKKNLSNIYKTPIYISKDTILVPFKNIKEYDNIWFNYKAIVKIKIDNDKLILFFDDYTFLVYNNSVSSYKKQENSIKMIEIFLEKGEI